MLYEMDKNMNGFIILTYYLKIFPVLITRSTNLCAKIKKNRFIFQIVEASLSMELAANSKKTEKRFCVTFHIKKSTSLHYSIIIEQIKIKGKIMGRN